MNFVLLEKKMKIEYLLENKLNLHFSLKVKITSS